MYAIEGEKYILSYGGGINSVALLLHILDKKLPLDEVVFADTGGEVPATYEYISTIKSILEKEDIQFYRVQVKKGTLYERCKNRGVIPSQIWRWCTRDLKIRPIYAHYRASKCKIHQYLGISYEEKDRKKDSNINYVNNIYPLIDNKITRDGCIDIINNHNLKLPVRSGCYFCPFNTISRWVEIYKKYNQLYDSAMFLEENAKFFPKQKLCNLTLRQLKNMINQNDDLPNIFIKKPCGSECVI